MAFDEARDEVVAFGGGPTRTWIWDGTNWSGESSSGGPGNRSAGVLAYHRGSGKVVFVGTGSGGMGDTWTWDGQRWELQDPLARPPNPNNGSLADDGQRLVLVPGGLAETWTWDGTNWSRETTASPPVRSWSTMVYDGARQRVVLFGGKVSSLFGLVNRESRADTWLWNGATRSWALQQLTDAPPARYGAGMVYDAVGQRVLLFGGIAYSAQNAVPVILGDTWTWDGSTWAPASSPLNPSPRAFPGMAYHAPSGRAVLFGGAAFQPSRLGSVGLNDTWTWDGAAESANSGAAAMSVSLAPSRIRANGTDTSEVTARVTRDGVGLAGHTVRFATDRSEGGVSFSTRKAMTDANGVARTSVTASTVAGVETISAITELGRGSTQLTEDPTPIGAALSVDDIRVDEGNSGTTDAVFTIRLSGPIDGPVRVSYATADGSAIAPADYQATTGTIELTAGETAKEVVVPVVGDTVEEPDETFTFSLSGAMGAAVADPTGSATIDDDDANAVSVARGAWREERPATSPPERFRTAMASYPPTQQVLLFGGVVFNPTTDLGDTWTWDGKEWTLRPTVSAPSPRFNSAMAYHAPSGRIVLFGGNKSSFGPPNDDTWTWDGTSWTEESPAAHPPPDGRHVMAYDEARREVVLLTTSSQTWIWNGFNWFRRDVAGPPARSGAAMASVGGEVILFGGNGDTGVKNDTWAWNGTRWRLKAPAISPPARQSASLAADLAAGRLVLFGGTRLPDTWTWDGTNWVAHASAPSPLARSEAAMATQTGSNKVLLFGGTSPADTWTWDGGATGPSAATNMSLSLARPSLPAHRSGSTEPPAATETTATITVAGVGVPNQRVEFTADGDVQISPRSAVTDGNGRAEVTVTASSTPGRQTITATAAVGQASAILVLEGAATSLRLGLDPSVLPADGRSASIATVVAKDANGSPVTTEEMAFASTDSGMAFSAATNQGGGVYTATVTASATPGTKTVTVTATKANVTASAALNQEPLASAVRVRLDPPSIPADGRSSSTVIVSVEDPKGNAVTYETVTLASTDPGHQLSPVVNEGNGTYLAAVTASNTPGRATIAATANIAKLSGVAVLDAIPLGSTAGTWAATGSMGAARSGHAAVLLSGTSAQCGENCNKVLVTADFNHALLAGEESQALAELYDPATGQWSATGAPLGGALTLTLITGPNCGGNCGKVLGTGLGSVAQLYNPQNGTWSVTSPRTKSGSFPAVVLSAGNCGARCGNVLVGNELYDPATDRWSMTSDTLGGQRGTIFALLAGPNCGANCGKVLVAGNDLNRAQLYDPVTGTWRYTAPMNFDRGEPAAAVLHDGRVLVTGSFVPSGRRLATAELYDPTTETWRVTGSMAKLRSQGHSLTVLSNGKVLTLGDPGLLTEPSAELYDPVTGQWTPTGPTLMLSGGYHTATLLADGRVLKAGGINARQGSPPPPMRDAEIYDGRFPPEARAVDVSVALKPLTILADGRMTSKATATVTDAAANPVTRETVRFSTDGDTTFSAVTNHGDGSYSATITASATPGAETVTATATLAGVSGTAVLNEAGQSPWVERTAADPTSAPRSRIGAAMAYHPPSNRVVLFGGRVSATPLGDTWTWDGASWARRSTTVSPPAQERAALAYYPPTQQVVLFGQGQTWTWDGSGWQEQHPARSPTSASLTSAMAYDPVGRRLVLFGDECGDCTNPGATWTWNGVDWKLESPATSPPDRMSPAMATDPASGKVVLFGGGTKDDFGRYMNDTWTWDGTSWSEQRPPTRPSIRFRPAMATDPATGKILLFGGQTPHGPGGNRASFDDTWSWDGVTWTEQHPATRPPGRFGAPMASHDATGRVVLFGGGTGRTSQDLAADTWTWDGNTPPPAPGIFIDSVRVAEGTLGTALARFTVQVAPPAPNPVTVSYATSDGTAAAPGDYEARSGSLTFGPGERRKTVAVPIVADGLDEAIETFTLNLSGASGAPVVDGQGVVTILDGDALPALVINSTTVVEGNLGPRPAVFQVSLVPPSTKTVTVNYATANGSASAPDDYQSASGTLTLAPGEERQYITVAAVGDAVDEPNEAFVVNLSGATNAVIGDRRALGTIADDDGLPVEGLAGGVVVTGADPDDHGGGPNGQGAKNTVRRAVAYATYDKPAPRLLYVTDGGTISPVGAESLAGSGQATVVNASASPSDGGNSVDLDKVNFDDFDAIVVASTFDLKQKEILALTRRRDDLVAFVRAGGGLVAFEEAGTGIGPGHREFTAFSYLPCIDGTGPGRSDDRSGFNSDEYGYQVTPAGEAIGLTPDDLERNPSHQSFPGTCGWDVVAYDPEGGINTVASRDGIADSGLSVDDLIVTEGVDDHASFTVTLPFALEEPVSVDYLTEAGSANEGEDFVAKRGRVTFDPGEVSQRVRVALVDDEVPEPTESFHLRLANPTDNAKLIDPVATAEILDPDIAVMRVAGVSVAEGNEAAVPAEFVVSLNAPSPEAVSVDYTTADVTAEANTDYAPRSGSLVFSPGQTTKVVSAPVLGDGVPEPTESFSLRLSNPRLATLGSASANANATITDDDVPEMSVADVTVDEGDSGTSPARFAVSLSVPSHEPVSVSFATTEATAIAGQDYAPTAGRLRFAPGQTTAVVEVPVLGDNVAEPIESFTLDLSSPTSATLGRTRAVGVIVDGDQASRPDPPIDKVVGFLPVLGSSPLPPPPANAGSPAPATSFSPAPGTETAPSPAQQTAAQAQAQAQAQLQAQLQAGLMVERQRQAEVERVGLDRRDSSPRTHLASESSASIPAAALAWAGAAMTLVLSLALRQRPQTHVRVMVPTRTGRRSGPRSPGSPSSYRRHHHGG